MGSFPDFWRHWGFEPWAEAPFAGVSRRQRFVKSGLLGRVAEFFAWDFIVWSSGTEEDRKTLWEKRGPMPEIISQRFLFLLEKPWNERRMRSFSLGFQGYLEFFAYCPGSAGHAKAKDLTGLVDLCCGLLRNGTSGQTGDGGKEAGATG
ncbi:MAG: hypothetical protein LBS70_06035 [Candidatus Accumulibacter sp.]|nr:hypothetical protein [Accumulibacter sp.]